MCTHRRRACGGRARRGASHWQSGQPGSARGPAGGGTGGEERYRNRQRIPLACLVGGGHRRWLQGRPNCSQHGKGCVDCNQQAGKGCAGQRAASPFPRQSRFGLEPASPAHATHLQARLQHNVGEVTLDLQGVAVGRSSAGVSSGRSAVGPRPGAQEKNSLPASTASQQLASCAFARDLQIPAFPGKRKLLQRPPAPQPAPTCSVVFSTGAAPRPISGLRLVSRTCWTQGRQACKV